MNTITNHCPQLTKSNSRIFFSSIKKIMMLLFFAFAYSNVASAQQPACNLTGILRARFNQGGGNTISITAAVLNAKPETAYEWSFKTNTSDAVIISGQGTPTVSFKAGTRAGKITLQLTVTNPNPDGPGTLSCTCTKSVSVNDQ